ncbi:hypothetical protein MPER_11744 [Moniliophthora perniciosa FA553]|nr:hypothetical protein MPER_11744 [Moniliophthora perniciosa FA553]
MPRKKRILEDLPVTPPPELRKPSAAELAAQEESDQRTFTLLKFRLGPILKELKRKFKRFAKAAREEYRFDFEDDQPQIIGAAVVEVHKANGIIEITEDVQVQQPPHVMNGAVNGVAPAPELAPPPQARAQPKLFDMDLEKIHTDLYRDRYLTPQEFMDDLKKIVHNAESVSRSLTSLRAWIATVWHQMNDCDAVGHVPEPTPFEQSNDMMSVDVPQQGPSRSAGFDPTLLNPLPDDAGPASAGRSAPGSRHPSIPPTAANDDPFLAKPLSRQASIARQSNSPHSPPPKSPEPFKEPSSIPIPGTPTPLPDFHVDETMLVQLQSSLKAYI